MLHASCPVRFLVRARAEPGVLPRITGAIARLNLIPTTLQAVMRQRVLLVSVEFDNDGHAALLAGAFASIIGVYRVRIVQAPSSRAAVASNKRGVDK